MQSETPRGGDSAVTAAYIFWRYVFLPPFAGAVFLIAGLISIRSELSFTLNELSVLGPVFVAAALAEFGAEHLTDATGLSQMVPAWMPVRLFWAYFVGFALFAAATSFVLKRYVRVAAALLGIMFVLFVLMIHVPEVVTNPKDRFTWAVALRDLVFGLGAWSLAGGQMAERSPRAAARLIACCRIGIAAVLLCFGIEHVLHPEFTPGVPLEQLTPAWIPGRAAWGYVVGATLVTSGALILVNKQSRVAATWLGIAVTAVVLFVNLPMLVVATGTSPTITAENFVGDTLLFAGAIFLLAAALPVGPTPSGLARQMP
jgi:uncharacterized membrane protein